MPFAIDVTLKMIDPLTLLVAIGAGTLTASRKTAESRWTVLVVSIAIIVLAIVAMDVLSSSRSGRLFSFDWAGAVGASLEVYLVAWVVGVWRAKAPRQSTFATPAVRTGVPACESRPAALIQ